MDVRIKFVIAGALFVVGASLVLQAFNSVASLWLLIPGILLIGLAYPWAHVLWAQFRSGHRAKTDEETLQEATLSTRSHHDGQTKEK